MEEQILINIRAIRKQKGIKQSEIAQKIGIKQSAYSHHESGQSALTIERIEIIAKALGVSFMDIISYHLPKDYDSELVAVLMEAQESIDNAISKIKQSEKQKATS